MKTNAAMTYINSNTVTRKSFSFRSKTIRKLQGNEKPFFFADVFKFVY